MERFDTRAHFLRLGIQLSEALRRSSDGSADFVLASPVRQFDLSSLVPGAVRSRCGYWRRKRSEADSISFHDGKEPSPVVARGERSHDHLVVTVGLGPIEPDQDHATLGRKTRSIREFAEIRVGCDHDSLLCLSKGQHCGIIGAGH